MKVHGLLLDRLANARNFVRRKVVVTATICSSVKRTLRIAPSESGASLSCNSWSEIPGAVQYHEKRIPCDPFLDDYTVSMRMLSNRSQGTLSLMRVNGYGRRHLHIPETA